MAKNILQWTCNNKLLVFFALSSFCLLISTVTLAQKRSGLNARDAYALIRNKQPSGFIQYVKEEDIVYGYKYYRLPNNVKPTNYNLYLSPSMTNKTFQGSVSITIRVIEQTKVIALHSNKLTIKSVELKNVNDSKNISIQSTELVTDKREFLYVKMKNKIPKGNYKLSIIFEGKLEGIVGFYSSSMKNGGTMVASKFQPTYARQAFPCFDEPEFKATYDITLVKPPSYTALSNMNEISKSVDESTNTEVVSFATSVPMSTYLACFVICDFDCKVTDINANGIGNNFKLRSFAQKGETHKIDFAQDIGKRATEFYIRYYEVPFPLPKLDMIAIPDYVSGATEHWGLITYRETSFLVDASTASSKNKISVANTIAHELAHMWFGNLVTMKWWDEVWLNEGFASYMQVKALNYIEPSWTMLDQFLTKTLHTVLRIDAKLSSHPIVQNVATPDQITAIFDSISYNKGASVLRMLEGFIGEENFRLGVSDYLKKYKFDNTITQDLLSSLEPYFKKDNLNLNLMYIMDTWTRQMGYPLLTLAPSEDDPRTFVVTQKRFLLDPGTKNTNDSQFNYRWFVPITYKTNRDQNKNIVWFPDTANDVRITLTEGETWLKINNNQVGYYRVNYPIEMWQNLIQQLQAKSPQFTISDRAHLLNDVFALAEARVVPYELALNLTTYLTVEDDYVPWEAATLIFSDLASKLLNSLSHDDLQKYIQRLLKPLYEKQNWDRTEIGVIAGLLRTRILSLAVRYQLPEAEAKVRSMFLSWLNSHGTPNVMHIEPDLRDFVYFYGMKAASQSDWEKLWQIYLHEKDVQESTKIRSALAAPRDTNILRRYLMLAWDEANIRSQDYLLVLTQIAGNPSGTALVWDDVRSRWPQLIDRFTLNSRYLGNIIPGITGSFDTELKLKEVESFFQQYPEAGAGEASRRRALETVRSNILWADTHKPAVAAWLQSHCDK